MTRAEAGRLGGLTAARRMTKKARKARSEKAIAARWKNHDKRSLRTFSIPKMLAERPQPVIVELPPGNDGALYFAEHPPGMAGVILRTPMIEVEAITVDRIRRSRSAIYIPPSLRSPETELSIGSEDRVAKGDTR